MTSQRRWTRSRALGSVGFVAVALAANLARGIGPYVAVVTAEGTGIGRYHPQTGDYLDTLAGGFAPDLNHFELTRGPDGDFYVTSGLEIEPDSFRITRIDAATGQATLLVNGAGLGGLQGLAFGPNGNLFVAAPQANRVLQFDAATGALIGPFVDNLAHPVDVAFAPDGTMYVARGRQELGSSSIERYNGLTGQHLGAFATTHLDSPRSVLVGPDGDVYATNESLFAEPVVRFYGATGAFKLAFGEARAIAPEGLAFAPSGELLVASSATDFVQRFNPDTGEFLGTAVTTFSPVGVVVVPEGRTAVLSLLAALGFLVTRCDRPRTPAQVS